MIYGRSRGQCLARASGCILLHNSCTLVGVPPTGCLRVALFVTERYLWSFRPLTSHFLPALFVVFASCAHVQQHRLPPGGSEVAHKWADWPHYPCRPGSPTIQSTGQNQKRPTSGQIDKMRLLFGVPTALDRGTKPVVTTKWADWLHHPLPSVGSPTLQSGGPP